MSLIEYRHRDEGIRFPRLFSRDVHPLAYEWRVTGHGSGRVTSRERFVRRGVMRHAGRRDGDRCSLGVSEVTLG